ncbi:MAG: DUF2178 domain-containing protein [Candidatus Doudnabacteria bacterium]|nr:DUF2178 domain-containing protein [Candidatus Doudnabacteria bacterium]
MTIKQYKFIKAFLVVGLAVVVGQAVVRDNWLLAVPAIAITAGLMLILKHQVKEVLADERDYEIGGRAARYAMNAFTVLAVIAMFALLAFKRVDPAFEVVSAVLAYSVCFLLLLYSLIFTFLNKAALGGKKFWHLAVAVGLILAFAIAGLRLFSGEDTWICRNGQWIKHGVPSAPMPTKPCR